MLNFIKLAGAFPVMRTYLIPTDFSASSVASAHFAAALSRQTGVTRLILLHAYHITTFENVMPTAEFVQLMPDDIDENCRLKLAELNDIKAELQQVVNAGVEIEIVLSRLPLLRAILAVEEDTYVDLLILCADDDENQNSQVGRNIIQISRKSEVPVLVVPQKATAATLRKIVLACDFKNIKEAIPQEKLKKVWTLLNARLLVVNVDQRKMHENKDPKMIAEESVLAEMLQDYNPEYHFIKHPDTIQGIVDFAEEHDAQIIISLPKRYSFFQSFMRDSISSRLTIKSKIPVLLLK